MRIPVRNRLLLSLLVCLPLFLSRPIQAQWKFVAQLPAGVSTVHFLDKVGTPNVGFVGLTNGMMRTSDGGVSWSGVMAAGFNIRDFVFWDAQHGMAVCAGANGVFLTADGGINWWQVAWFGTRSTSAIFFPCNNTLFINSL
jgi:photosystem II stability/assembly factor-like uncharacterized protein